VCVYVCVVRHLINVGAHARELGRLHKYPILLATAVLFSPYMLNYICTATSTLQHAVRSSIISMPMSATLSDTKSV